MTGHEEDRLRILVCDDHALFRRAVVTALEDAGLDVVAEADTGRTAVEQALEHAPDVVVMDLRMPDGDGASATEEITTRRPWTRILVLTVSDDLDEISGAICAGAIGHLRKEEAMQVLPDVIADVMAGGVHLGRALLRRIGHELGRLTDPYAAAANPAAWRPTEAHLRLVGALADGASLEEAAASAGIPAEAARTELRAAIEGLHRSLRSGSAA
ncbi:response regulator [Actinomarinicola tropica]|uniref:Response regulator n=1 Tax=Actinomarinicola tropica TaxID=2789776 RepID=A0A5Q2RMK6_9ACTN|nr:response regulator transcription factor [Actinomarinicola tropica]QGG95791.1 response regulator [Actinomarinicola tropica]